jgi:hypothetical protein
LDPVKNGVVSQGAYDRPLDDVKRRIALDILAEVRRKGDLRRKATGSRRAGGRIYSKIELNDATVKTCEIG